MSLLGTFQTSRDVRLESGMVTTMAALAKALSRVPETQVDVETLKTIVIFCGVGLTLSLILASYGLDLSPGFF
jgi:hypothetical protein